MRMLSDDELKKAFVELAHPPKPSEKEEREIRSLVRKCISEHGNRGFEPEAKKKNTGFPLVFDKEEDEPSQSKSSQKKQSPRRTDK
jgi:hypothetical protein